MSSSHNKIISLLLSLFILLISHDICGQEEDIELVDVVNINKYEYGGCSKNYGISTDNSGKIFLANAMGMIEYNGSKWTLHHHPNNYPIHQIYINNKGTIFTTSYSEIGIWYKNSQGTYSYRKLITPYDNTVKKYQISGFCEASSGSIYFNRAGKVYRFADSKVVDTQVRMNTELLFDSKNHIESLLSGKMTSFQKRKEEVDQIINKNPKLKIKKIIRLKEYYYALITEENRIYLQKDKNKAVEWTCLDSEKLQQATITRIEHLNENVIIGTKHNGLVIYNTQKGEKIHVQQNNHLTGKTITDLVVDSQNRILVSSLTGLTFIQTNYPSQTYYFPNNIGNESYTATIFAKQLLVGTDLGLYSISEENVPDSKVINIYKRINLPIGRVWSLTKTKEGLVCGHSSGTYLIDSLMRVTKISEYKNGQNFKPISFDTMKGKYWIQNTSEAIVLYQYPLLKSKAKKFSTITNPDIPLEVYNNYIWTMKSGDNNIYRIPIRAPKGGLIKQEKFHIENRLHIERFQLVNGNLFFFTTEGLYRYDQFKDKIIECHYLKDQLKKYYYAIKSVRIAPNQYWFIHSDEIGLFNKNKTSVENIINYTFNDQYHSLIDEFEYILPISANQSLVCIKNGFTIVSHKPKNRKRPLKLWIEEIQLCHDEQRSEIILQEEIKDHFITRGPIGRISFTISSEQLPKKKLVTQYRLNNDSTWTDFDHNHKLTFSNLKADNYTLEVRSLDELNLPQGKIKFHFKIKPCWYNYYGATIAIIIFIVSVVVLCISRHFSKYNQRKIRILTLKNQQITQREQKRKLENEKELIELKNLNLQNELDAKSEQLILFALEQYKTKEIIEKIKFRFQQLKKDLKYRLPDKYYDAHIDYLNQLLEEKKDTSQLGSFIEKQNQTYINALHNLYPELDQKELRICVLLKLNLSNKRISELIQLSTRTIELYRHNIRKKLNLQPNVNLQHFLVNIIKEAKSS